MKHGRLTLILTFIFSAHLLSQSGTERLSQMRDTLTMGTDAALRVQYQPNSDSLFSANAKNALPLKEKYSSPKDSIVQYYSRESKKLMDAIVVDGDTIPILTLDEVLLVDRPSFDTEMARRRFYMLHRKVIKVYPYAVIAGNKLDSLNILLKDIKGQRKRKKFIKEFQDYLEDKFENQLRQLTRSEGQILSKLIYRETHITTYDLIRDYRSGWNAFWWNTAAHWYDIELKTPYDPERVEEDKLIENILLRSFAQSLLKERVPITEF